MTAPQFYDTDINAIKARLITRYEVLTGRSLLPAQPEALVLEACAYEIKIYAEQNQSASQQQLLPWASGVMLDYLAEPHGVERLASSAATVNLRFTAATGHGGFTLPAGTRVATATGQATFLTDADVVVTPGETTIDVSASALTFGLNANGLTPGLITRIIDRRAELVSVTNTSTSGGGADLETDPEFRERIRLASSRLSVAGPANAYKFYARQASPSVIDVSVITPEPGTVNVYPLVQGGVVTPQTVIDQVIAALDNETVIPLASTVVVLSPSRIEQDFEIQFELYADADATTALADARARIVRYLFARETVLGLDMNLNQLIAVAVGDASEVSDVTVVLPLADIELDETQFLKTTDLITTVTGVTNG